MICNRANVTGKVMEKTPCPQWGCGLYSLGWAGRDPARRTGTSEGQTAAAVLCLGQRNTQSQGIIGALEHPSGSKIGYVILTLLSVLASKAPAPAVAFCARRATNPPFLSRAL